LFHEILHL
jgi:sugar phosphate isomerase/epimerase